MIELKQLIDQSLNISSDFLHLLLGGMCFHLGTVLLHLDLEVPQYNPVKLMLQVLEVLVCSTDATFLKEIQKESQVYILIKGLEIQNELAAGVELLRSRIKNICLQIFEEAYNSILGGNICKYTFFVNMLFIEV